METRCATFTHNEKTVVIQGWANSISNLIFENGHVDLKQFQNSLVTSLCDIILEYP